MKKKMIVISSLILVFAIFLTACGKSTVVDKSGNEHSLYQDWKGKTVQDSNGNLIENATDDSGSTYTQAVTYPDVLKAGKNKIQNAYLIVNIPDEWSYDDSINKLRINHTDGKCADYDNGTCQFEVTYDNSYTLDEVIANYYDKCSDLTALSPDTMKNLKKSSATVLGKKAKVVTYYISDTGFTVYLYAFKYKNAITKITALVNDKCKKEIDPVEFINKNFTLKPLGE